MFTHHHYTPSLCDAAKVALARGTTDINSGTAFYECLSMLVDTKQLNMSIIDRALRRSFMIRFRLGLFDPDRVPILAPSVVHTAASAAKSQLWAAQSIVLLQNHNHTLPLARESGQVIAILGPHAKAKAALLGNYIGQVCHEGKHSFECVQSPQEAFETYLTEHGRGANVEGPFARVNQDRSTAPHSILTSLLTSEIDCDWHHNDTSCFASDSAVASKADIVILCLGLDQTIEREMYICFYHDQMPYLSHLYIYTYIPPLEMRICSRSYVSRYVCRQFLLKIRLILKYMVL